MKIKWYCHTAGRTVFLISILLLLAGCHKIEEKESFPEVSETQIDTTLEYMTIAETQTSDQQSDTETEAAAESAPTIEEMDWAEYFNGRNGTAVFYHPQTKLYQIYNPELAAERRSPCSTFKIISSFMGLKEGVIQTDSSVRTWSGETYWNEAWNQDIDFEQAFRSSCIWYFREVTDDLATAIVQEELNTLQYGNCDISDWNGELNTNNNIPALKGFWVESSLKISPKEQTEVLERIFGEASIYPQNVTNSLKQVMLLTEQTVDGVNIYGKTGLGKVEGKTVDAWYVGFVTQGGDKIFFAVYLGASENLEVSSSIAKEIALDLIENENPF